LAYNCSVLPTEDSMDAILADTEAQLANNVTSPTKRLKKRSTVEDEKEEAIDLTGAPLLVMYKAWSART